MTQPALFQPLTVRGTTFRNRVWVPAMCQYTVTQRDGVPMRLEHDHIMKLGLKGPLPHGTKVEMGGHGEVTESGTHEVDGEPRHHMTITMTRAGVEPQETASDRRDDLRADIEKAHHWHAAHDTTTSQMRAKRT